MLLPGQGWTNFFLGAQLSGRAILLARPIGHAKNGWSKGYVRSRHNKKHRFLFFITYTGLAVVGKWSYGLRPQVIVQMPIVGLKWVWRCCLSIVTLGHAYPLSRLSLHHLLRDSRRKLPMKRISFLPNKYEKNWTALLQQRQKQTSTLAD